MNEYKVFLMDYVSISLVDMPILVHQYKEVVLNGWYIFQVREGGCDGATFVLGGWLV